MARLPFYNSSIKINPNYPRIFHMIECKSVPLIRFFVWFFQYFQKYILFLKVAVFITNICMLEYLITVVSSEICHNVQCRDILSVSTEY